MSKKLPFVDSDKAWEPGSLSHLTKVKKRKKPMKEMEYEDAPSGYVKLYNYKEPFMEFTGGHGYQGVLLFDGATDKVQCHFCGKWLSQLSGKHTMLHGVRPTEYKEIVGLAPTTALIGEGVREKLIEHGRNQIGNLKVQYGKKTKETREKISKTLKENRRENQNLKGTCPYQLIDRLRKRYAELGRTPLQTEFKGYNTIVRVYGSWKRACEFAGIPHIPTGWHNETGLKYSKKDVLEWVRAYVEANGKTPRWEDVRKMDFKKNATIFKHLKNGKYGKFNEVVAEAVASDGKYRKFEGKVMYSREQLLDFLRNFERFYGRLPAISDCKRGLLPSQSSYYHRFGNWKGALRAAGLQE